MKPRASRKRRIDCTIAGALDEDLAHLGIDQIDIAHPVSQLHVGEAVEFFRQRQQILREKRQLLYMHAQLAGAGAEQVSLHADVVADVEQLVKLPLLVADRIFLHINLQLLARLLEMGETGLAHQADGNQPPGNGNVDAFGFQLLRRCWRCTRPESGAPGEWD